MKKSKFVMATVVTAGVAVCTAVPAFAGGGDTHSIEELIPVLAAPATAADSSPSDLDLEALGGIDPESLRSLGGDDVGEYWVGRAGTAEVCLITRLAVDRATAASTCAPITTFYRSGLSLVTGVSTDDPSLVAEAYLLPADIEWGASPNATRARTPDRSHSFVAGRPDRLVGVESFQVQREDGSTFHFNRLSISGAEQ